MIRRGIGATVVLGMVVAGCSGTTRSSTPTATPTSTVLVTPTSPAASATATPLPTQTPIAVEGPRVSYFGLAAANDTVVMSSGVDDAGRPIFVRPFGQGFSLVIEGRPGSEGTMVGSSAFDYDPSDPSIRPDLQTLVSRPLGDGSPEVCDNGEPVFGGIPAVDPPSYDVTQPISDAINDLGCRFDNGTGNPGGRGSTDACTLFEDGEFRFVNPASTIQFCARIAGAFNFPMGDTIVTARLRSVDGTLGAPREIVVRIDPGSLTLTPRPTPTPTPQPPLEDGGNITFFGLAGANDFVLEPIGVDGLERPIYEARVGRGFSLVIEGQPGANGRPVGLSTFEYDPNDASVRPDLQVLASQSLGNGSLAVCDNFLPDIGGVPAVDPPSFAQIPDISAALSDLGCRFVDGQGNPRGRMESEACTLFSDGSYHFVATSTVQFCARIAGAFAFPVGDTVVTARLRDRDGVTGPERQIVVRVPAQPVLTAAPTPTPTEIPAPGEPGEVTYFGIASASDAAQAPTSIDDDGRAVYARSQRRGFSLVIEGKPLPGGRNIGRSAFRWDPEDPTVRPDLQVLVSRPLGDGSVEVCDNGEPVFGGVPAVDPPDFAETQAISDAINDFGCRFNDGSGNPGGRTSGDACTVFPDASFHFVDNTSQVQYCAPIVGPYRFPAGDTIVTARIGTGPAKQIVIRINE